MNESTKICPNCNNECLISDIFCSKCGSKFEQELKCPQCGTKYEKDDVYCGECGQKLENEIQKPKEEPVQQIKESSANAQKENYNQSSYNICCPYCHSKIQTNTKKCPHCGEWINGGSHFGCGSFLMITTIILGIISALGAFSFEVPWLGEVTGAVALVFIIIVLLYLLPSLIADSRGHESKFGIFLVNLFFGWSIIGWFVALILAFSGQRR